MIVSLVLMLSASGAIAAIHGAAIENTTTETSLAANCSLTCPQIPKHYEELGCLGVTLAGSCCPERLVHLVLGKSLCGCGWLFKIMCHM